jgi:hypothetical protein
MRVNLPYTISPQEWDILSASHRALYNGLQSIQKLTAFMLKENQRVFLASKKDAV